jgi:hypothetical protein
VFTNVLKLFEISRPSKDGSRILLELNAKGLEVLAQFGTSLDLN